MKASELRPGQFFEWNGSRWLCLDEGTGGKEVMRRGHTAFWLENDFEVNPDCPQCWGEGEEGWICRAEAAIDEVRKIVAVLSEGDKQYLRNNSSAYRQLIESCRTDEMNKLRRREDGFIEHIKQLEKQVAELRAIKFCRFGNEDYWIYQGDGSDHLESLVCPVVVSPQQMIEFEQLKQSKLQHPPTPPAPAEQKQ